MCIQLQDYLPFSSVGCFGLIFDLVCFVSMKCARRVIVNYALETFRTFTPGYGCQPIGEVIHMVSVQADHTVPGSSHLVYNTRTKSLTKNCDRESIGPAWLHARLLTPFLSQNRHWQGQWDMVRAVWFTYLAWWCLRQAWLPVLAKYATFSSP